MASAGGIFLQHGLFKLKPVLFSYHRRRYGRLNSSSLNAGAEKKPAVSDAMPYLGDKCQRKQQAGSKMFFCFSQHQGIIELLSSPAEAVSRPGVAIDCLVRHNHGILCHWADK